MSNLLSVPVSLDSVLRDMLPSAYALLPAAMKSDRADVMMLAIGLQESRFKHRRQIGGPARGFWQFEKGGGVKGVLTHPSTRAHVLRVCQACSVEPKAVAVYPALALDDTLAGSFARLLLYSDAAPLPKLGEPEAAWSYYLRNWRPGKPHRQTWDAFYARAMAAVAR